MGSAPDINTAKSEFREAWKARRGAKEEAKNESKMGHDLAKGADRFEERSKSSDGKAQQKNKRVNVNNRPDAAFFSKRSPQ